MKPAYTNYFNVICGGYRMASYSAQVSAIHKKFKSAAKKARTAKSLDKAYLDHKKAHTRLLKRHLKEEMAMVKKLKKKLK